MKLKILVLASILLCNSSFAQESKKLDESIAWTNPVVKTNVKENIPENCIGHGGDWANCMPVETSAVLPLPKIETTSIKPMDTSVKKESNLPVKIKEGEPKLVPPNVVSLTTNNVVDTPIKAPENIINKSVDKVEASESIVKPSVYPDNIEMYKDNKGITNFTNDSKTIKPGTKTIKVDLNKLPVKNKSVEKSNKKIMKKPEKIQKVNNTKSAPKYTVIV